MAKSPTKNRNKKKRNDYKLGLCLTSLRSLPCGKDWVKIAQDKNMHEATVRSIYAKKEEIKKRIRSRLRKMH